MANIQEIEDQIASLTMLEPSQLVRALESRLGVSARQAEAIAVQPSPTTQAIQEQTEFAVVIKEAGPTEINVIKAVREVSSLGPEGAEGLRRRTAEAAKRRAPRGRRPMVWQIASGTLAPSRTPSRAR